MCHRLEECYFLQNIYLGVEVADDAVAAVNEEFPWVVKSLSILSCESLQDKIGCPPKHYYTFRERYCEQNPS